jgi:hypothetical protein
LAAGGLAGACHLARADGPLFLAIGVGAALLSRRRRLGSTLALVVGYALVVLPWWLHNLSVTGSLLPQGAGRVLWLTAYDDLFAYPADLLTPARWWASGLGTVVRARAQALWLNTQTLVGVNGLVFLLPLMGIGAWRLRGRAVVRLTAVYLVLLYGVMTVVFPFAGSRGGAFHSSAAAMPVLWALVPIGLEQAVGWGARRRGWQPDRALAVFSVAAVVLCAAVTLALAAPRLADTGDGPAWEAGRRAYARVYETLQGLASPQDVVAVNNPPGFHLATGLSAVVIPNGDPAALRAVVERYGVDWVVIDANLPVGLRHLMDQPRSVEWLTPIGGDDPIAGEPILLRVEPLVEAPGP